MELESTLQLYEEEKAKLLMSAPNSNQSDTKNLEDALNSIVKKVQTTSQEEIEEFKVKVKNLERELLAKDKKLTQFELKFSINNSENQGIAKSNFEEQTRSVQMLKMATDTIHTLQNQLKSKDEALNKYQDMLQVARQDAIRQREVIILFDILITVVYILL
jgi:hypothetical protein